MMASSGGRHYIYGLTLAALTAESMIGTGLGHRVEAIGDLGNSQYTIKRYF